jgi:hypothetical protein
MTLQDLLQKLRTGVAVAALATAAILPAYPQTQAYAAVADQLTNANDAARESSTMRVNVGWSHYNTVRLVHFFDAQHYGEKAALRSTVAKPETLAWCVSICSERSGP